MPEATGRMDPVDELHLLLGKLVHAFARFDFNVGLQLKWLGPYCGVEVGALLSARTPFARRFNELEPLVISVFGRAPGARGAFQDWFDRVKAAKAVRNDFAHGRWSPWPLRDAPVPTFEFVALHWEMDPEVQPPAARVSLQELREAVAAIESLFREYARLEKHYMSGARPPKA